MTGRGRRRLRAIAGCALVAGLVAAQGLQAAALRDCPHHGGNGVHAGAPVAAAPLPDMHAFGHAAGSTSHVPRDDAHDGPCDCLGPCGVSAALEAPLAPAESILAQVAPRRLVEEAGGPRIPALRLRPFVLPYPNAPPA